MKTKSGFILLCILGVCTNLLAQFNSEYYIGSTISLNHHKSFDLIIVDDESLSEDQYHHPLVMPAIGFGASYQYKRIEVASGIHFKILGSSRSPQQQERSAGLPWKRMYVFLSVPIEIRYQVYKKINIYLSGSYLHTIYKNTNHLNVNRFDDGTTIYEFDGAYRTQNFGVGGGALYKLNDNTSFKLGYTRLIYSLHNDFDSSMYSFRRSVTNQHLELGVILKL